MKTPDKIIFLDFDGVLNSKYTKDRVRFGPWNQLFRGLDAWRVKLVSDLAAETGAKVIISSTWRQYYTRPELQKLLEGYGWQVPIHGYTPQNHERSEDIQGWFELNGAPAGYVVLDDIQTKFKENQVLTVDEVGFTAQHLEKAKEILKGP